MNNAIYHFDKGHVYIRAALEAFARIYRPDVRISVGPDLMTEVYLSQMCALGRGEEVSSIGPDLFPPERCRGVNIIPQISFYPFGWFSCIALYAEHKSHADWEKVFKDSLGVHMYSSSVHAKKKIRRPRFYGKDVPAYLHLAMNHCPLAFYSENIF